MLFEGYAFDRNDQQHLQTIYIWHFHLILLSGRLSVHARNVNSFVSMPHTLLNDLSVSVA